MAKMTSGTSIPQGHPSQTGLDSMLAKNRLDMYLLSWLSLTKAYVLTLHLSEFDVRTVTGRHFVNDGSVDVASRPNNFK